MCHLLDFDTGSHPPPTPLASPGDLLTMLPFGNTIVVKDITGLALLTALENGVLGDLLAEDTRGAFPQVRLDGRHLVPHVNRNIGRASENGEQRRGK